MDVLFYFTIVTIIAILEAGIQVKANDCTTDAPNAGHCGQMLTVISGTACYSGNHKTLATIYCDTSYSFDSETTFTCIKTAHSSYWTPNATAACLFTASLYSTTTFTPNLLLSESTLPSNEISSTKTPTSLFTLKVLSSENTLFSTVISSDDTETPPLTTHTMMPHTETMASSSDVQIETSTVYQATTSFRHSSVPSSTITASSVLVTPNPAPSRKVKDADINAVYVAVPVVVCVIALLLGVGILWWRRRNHKPTALFERREPGSLITNQVYGANGIDRNCSLMNVRQSRVNEYAEIPLDIMNSDETVGDTYQTIDIFT
ncbi:uncharacterized protein LOC132719187 [Ruditapes philippinarum]|uniref:uncharacterized protein LOC132719187 n=1 Tax=Ruditapes philippinarum TaxID=129788 RepID=UPI00295AD23E|nr:uncharacterized protein LOC132719187 [Ruditapes philippinarum]